MASKERQNRDIVNFGKKNGTLRVISAAHFIDWNGKEVTKTEGNIEESFADDVFATHTAFNALLPKRETDPQGYVHFTSKTVVDLPIVGDVILNEKHLGKDANGFNNARTALRKVRARLREVAKPATA